MSDTLLKIAPPCLKAAATDEALKQELLSAHLPPDSDKPRKGTKLYIISQIEHLCGTAGIPIAETNRELNRQSKAQLKGTLAHYMERASERRMKAAQTIVAPAEEAADASPNRAANVFVLRMLHDTVLGGVEKLYEAYGKPYVGYTIDGLNAKLREEPLTTQVDEILVQIAEECPELLDYFESPYARLGLCWLMAAVQVARKNKVTKPNGRNGNVPAEPGHGAPELGRRPGAVDGGKRLQPPDLRPKKGGEKLPDKPAADKTSRTGPRGPRDSGVRRERALLRPDEQILRPEILLQGVAPRIV